MLESLPVNDLVLMAAGAFLALIGAALNDARKDRYRRRAMFEEACLEWLNTQGTVLGRLKRVAEAAQKDPESIEAHEAVLAAFAPVELEVKKLNECLNAAAVYNQSFIKGWVIEHQSALHNHLHRMLEIIISHHHSHLSMRKDMAEWQEGLKATSGATGNRAADELIQAVRQQINDLTDNEKERLKTCAASLIDDATYIRDTVTQIERRLPLFRRVIGSSLL